MSSWKTSHRDRFASRLGDARVCVTGGAGFIGGHLASALVDLGARVAVIDDLSNADADGIADLVDRHSERARFVHGSILDPGALADAMEGATAVFHLAAMGSVPRSIAEPERCMEVNLQGTVRVVEAARAVGASRVVNSSSSSVYGGLEPAPNRARAESDPTEPLSPYAASKLAAEHVLAAWARSYSLETVSLRYFNVFGPNQSPHSQYAAVIPAFASKLLAGERPSIFGDGSFSRDFTAVQNAVYANLLAATTESPLRGDAVNIGSGKRTTILDLHRKIATVVGRTDVEPRFEPVRAGDVPHSLADLSAARSLLGYEPVHDMAAGLSETVDWMRGLGEDGDRDVIFRIA